MREPEERHLVDTIARSFIGTPYHENGEVKGAGVDCATLLKLVFVEAGLIAPFEIGYYSPQWFLHQSEERYLGWIKQFAAEISLDEVKPGDVVCYHIAKCFAHAAIVIEPGWPNVVHAHFASKVVRRGDGRNPHLGTKVLDMKFFSRWAART